MPNFTAIYRKSLPFIRRYGPAELCGTAAAMLTAWLLMQATGSIAAAAIGGAISENIGYYSVAVARDSRIWWQRHHGSGRRQRVLATIGHTVRGIVLEFGPAELIDSFVVRPWLLYMVPTHMAGPPMLLFLVAKLLADCVFYGFAIVGFHMARRVEA